MIMGLFVPRAVKKRNRAQARLLKEQRRQLKDQRKLEGPGLADRLAATSARLQDAEAVQRERAAATPRPSVREAWRAGREKAAARREEAQP
jgi:hypothetical protein